MTDHPVAASRLKLIKNHDTSNNQPGGLLKFMNLLGITHADSAWVEKLPFALSDATAGTETELQAAVAGNREDVDLARAIEQSSYYKNIIRRVASGDAPRKIADNLEAYLNSSAKIWENSWVRFPRKMLNTFANAVFDTDLKANKQHPDGPMRADACKFTSGRGRDCEVRVPISYLLKLALAQVVGKPGVSTIVRITGEKMMDHFLNDNTSPETHSFVPVSCGNGQRLGAKVAAETLLRYLLSDLLAQYANQCFDLRASGQQAVIYFAPHPPIRQKQLNELISDSFYRQLFMSPCLSGWDQGEKKQEYMSLCHQVLSRSQLNAVAKLREAGIVANNLVVLPNTSNICLANNGTHLSLGSRRLTRLMANSSSGYGPVDEKYYGDLVLKICEHFLPLFVGTYSAAPYRFDFSDFHPERVLGFLPHELDYTHLRMLWRRWKKKAHINFFGHPVTPFGPEWLDRTVSRVLNLKGDFVLDFRLIDYLVALMSTDENPALDGSMDNDLRLKADLDAMGIFDSRMPNYLLLRLRQHHHVGFSGFEARHYSLFESFQHDMSAATDLQQLITVLAYKYILQHKFTHKDIADTPFIESERRQIIFGTAIGVPTFFIHKDSSNRLICEILKLTRNTRASRRYSGYIRTPGVEYRRALLRLLCRDASDLIEMLNMKDVIDDLQARIDQPLQYSAAHRLAERICKENGRRRPLDMRGSEFNQASEEFYRNGLKRQHLGEAFDCFRIAVRQLDSWKSWRSGCYNQSLMQILGGGSAEEFLISAEKAVLDNSPAPDVCEKLIYLLLLVLHQSEQKTEENR